MAVAVRRGVCLISLPQGLIVAAPAGEKARILANPGQDSPGKKREEERTSGEHPDRAVAMHFDS
jgi:hypothetical protein